MEINISINQETRCQFESCLFLTAGYQLVGKIKLFLSETLTYHWFKISVKIKLLLSEKLTYHWFKISVKIKLLLTEKLTSLIQD